jgi:anti-anti-sigma factor
MKPDIQPQAFRGDHHCMKYEIKDLGRFKAIYIIGNIDSSESTKILDNEISGLIRKGRRDFVFNLRKTTFLGSGGISFFIHRLCDVRDHHGSIFIVAEKNQVRRVLESVGINRLIKTYYSEKEFSDAQIEGKSTENMNTAA